MIKKLLLIAAITVNSLIATSTTLNTSITPLPIVELRGENTLMFSDDIDPITSDNFMAALIGKRFLLNLSASQQEKLYVIIVSPGGNYGNGLMMRAVINSVPNVVLICKYCASVAGFIFGTTTVPRLAIKKSSLIMHEMFLPHYTAENTYRPAIISSLRASSNEFDAAIYNKIGISKKEYRKKIVGTEWTLEGQDLVKYHLADTFVQLKCDDYVKVLAPQTCSN